MRKLRVVKLNSKISDKCPVCGAGIHMICGYEDEDGECRGDYCCDIDIMHYWVSRSPRGGKIRVIHKNRRK